jgi:hypothetical protein
MRTAYGNLLSHHLATWETFQTHKSGYGEKWEYFEFSTLSFSLLQIMLSVKIYFILELKVQK